MLRRLVTLAVVVALVATTGVVATVGTAAAATYPTWGDVQRARSSTAATQALIVRIRGAIAGLDASAQSAEAAAQTAGDGAQQADQAYQQQELVTQDLAAQQKTAQQQASDADAELGKLIAAEYRANGGDPTLSVLLDSGDPAALLDSYGIAEKLDQQFDEVHARALQAQQSVAALHKQADAAASILAKDKATSDAAYATASAASQKATAALAAQQSHEADLQALLVIAQKKQATTLADYRAGVVARAKAAALAKQQESAGDPGTIVGGWTLPARGPITSPYGWRFIFGAQEFHLGTDIGAACDAPEYAAHAGTVTYAGWNGVYGYYIAVDVGGGISIEYGHIRSGGILVSVGQQVAAGQVISRVGTTGTSTGCHLFYGVRIDGVVTDPQPFMKNRGITLGTY